MFYAFDRSGAPSRAPTPAAGPPTANARTASMTPPIKTLRTLTPRSPAPADSTRTLDRHGPACLVDGERLLEEHRHPPPRHRAPVDNGGCRPALILVRPG